MIKHRVRLALILAVALALLTVTVGAASAGPSWKGFGSGSATGRGDFGSPWVSVDSTTAANPKQVRMVVSSTTTTARSTRVSWSLSCWSEDDYDYDYLSGSKTVTVSKSKPFTAVWSATKLPVRNPDFCELDVSAYHFKTGNLKVALQAAH